MTKLESLRKLKEDIVEVDLADGNYCKHGKNCVIGHLLKLDGITEAQLKELDDGKYVKGSYGIETIINASLEIEYEDNFVKNSLTNLGFDLEKDKELLWKLQKANDSEGKRLVIKLLNEVIEELEKG